MDLDPCVINSIAVIGNIKLWSQVILWCYHQHYCCNQKGLQNPALISFWHLPKEAFLWFSRLLYTKLSSHTAPLAPTFLPMTVSNYKAGFQPSLVHGAPLPLLGGVKRPGGLQHRSTGSQKHGRRAAYPSQKCPVKVMLGLGEGHLISFRSRCGSVVGPIPLSLLAEHLQNTDVQPRDGAALWDGCTRYSK